jgi:hypothetical protein
MTELIDESPKLALNDVDARFLKTPCAEFDYGDIVNPFTLNGMEHLLFLNSAQG